MVMRTESNPYVASNAKAVLTDMLDTTLNSNEPSGGGPYGVAAGGPVAASGGAPVPVPSQPMGPRFQTLAERAGLGAVGQAAAPTVNAVGAAVPQGVSATMGAVAQGASQMPSFGRMKAYLDAYRNKGMRDFSNAHPPENIDDLAARLAMRESSGNAQVVNPHTPAAGLFQYMPDTWAGHGGFKSAAEAPEEVQYNKFITDLAGSLKRNKGDLPIGLLEHYVGAGDARNTLKNPSKLFESPGKYNAGETRYKRIAGLLGEDAASKWLAQHQTKLADATAALQNVYNVSQE